eukprot:scaffold32939_cov30-Tisochrysis_lutea.AAC.1
MPGPRFRRRRSCRWEPRSVKLGRRGWGGVPGCPHASPWLSSCADRRQGGHTASRTGFAPLSRTAHATRPSPCISRPLCRRWCCLGRGTWR